MKSWTYLLSVVSVLSVLCTRTNAFSCPSPLVGHHQIGLVGSRASLSPHSFSALSAQSDKIEMSEELNRPINKQQWINFSLLRNSRGILGAGIFALAGLVLSLPMVANAVDVASAASSTNNFVAGLVETGFYQAFSLVFVSEIGDKTFFMAGLLAAQTSRFISFLGSMGALAVMTIISVVIGQVFHAVPSGIADGIPLDDLAAVIAFTFFGLKTLKDALDMEEGGGSMEEEFEEANEDVEKSAIGSQGSFVARILAIFGLVFAAEFGDRSFLSTIALSAAQNPVSVAAGAIAAHGVATGIAVSGGAVAAKYLSEKTIGLIGGTLFIVFAVTTALGIF